LRQLLKKKKKEEEEEGGKKKKEAKGSGKAAQIPGSGRGRGS
jgi:hypothetical protein